MQDAQEIAGSILRSKRSPGGGNGNPLQLSCLENLMDREAWQTAVHGTAKESDTAWRLSTHFSYTPDRLHLHQQQYSLHGAR